MLNQPETKPDYFIQIPPEVLFEPKLSAGAKLFYGEVLFLTYTYGFCSQKNAYFAANHGVSLRTVENWIKELKNQNLITVELIRKQNQEVELRKIFALVKIDFSMMPCANQGTGPKGTSPPVARSKCAQQKKPYGVNQNVFYLITRWKAFGRNTQKSRLKKPLKITASGKSAKVQIPGLILIPCSGHLMN